MTKDIEQELDDILAHHKTRVAHARNAAAGRDAAEEDFSRASAACLADVITPAFKAMAHALNERGVAARVPAGADAVQIDIPVSRHTRLGHGHGGYPYLRARPEPRTRRILFERNTADGLGGRAVGDYAIAEVDAELVKGLVMDLVRGLFGPS